MSRETPSPLLAEKAIFLEALDLGPEARAAYLASACDGAPGRRERIERLLAADSAASFLDRGAWLAKAPAPPPEVLEGQRLGAYRVLREIGRGGMGAVYLAERADQAFERLVAVKVVRSETISAASAEHFLRERRILARLDHPGIARLLDGGTAPGGSAYFVLEYVEGEVIDRYCHERGLSLGERVGLFCEVCAAVAHAHKSLVVHQDIKPSNLLVTNDGRVKLLDFGIARILRRDMEGLDPTSPYAALTPGYASPEQVRGEAVTTASDVYSLGVLLFQLLTGVHPYGDEASLSPAAWLDAVCEKEPPPPSVAVLRGDAADGARGQLARQLAGDLDTVVLKAMAKEPGDRYASVEHFAEDLRRWLGGFPILARPASGWTRLRKFARRHPVASAALAAVAVAVIAVGVLSVLLTRQNHELDRQRAAAEEVSAFATGIFQLAEPGRLGSGELSALELLEEGERRAFDDLADQPETRARMLDVLGTAYLRLTLFERARAALTEAVRLHQQAPKQEPLALAESRFHLAEALRRLQDFAAAEPLYREALAARREALGANHTAVAEVLAGLGELLLAAEGPEAAEPVLEEARGIFLGSVGEASPQVANVLYQQAAAAERRRDFERSGKLFETARRLTEETLGTRHIQYAQCLYGLGVYHFDTGDLDTGGDYLAQALSLQEALFAPGDYRLVQTLTNLGLFHSFRGRSALAVDYLRRAIEQGLIHHRDQPILDRIRLSLVAILLDRGGLEEARTLTEELIRSAEAKPDHPYLDSGQAERLMARLLILEGDSAEAERMARRLLTAATDRPRPDPLQVASAWRLLGDTQLELGRLDEARAAFDRASEANAGLPQDHPLQLVSLGSRVELALAAGDPQAALAAVRRARELAPNSLAGDPVEEAWYQGVEGEALALTGDTVAARPLLEESRRRLLELLGDQAPAVADADRRLGLLERPAG
ncbi:MAG: tetratricopeptide repeat protein [Acidobacteria bacterium]|nr:tetratricopeptide repeat protein [Acidobacteriota bacterium]